jgi:hypothetical protein
VRGRDHLNEPPAIAIDEVAVARRAPKSDLLPERSGAAQRLEPAELGRREAGLDLRREKLSIEEETNLTRSDVQQIGGAAAAEP